MYFMINKMFRFFFLQKFCIFALQRRIEDEDQLHVRFTFNFRFNKRKMIFIFNTVEMLQVYA